MVQKALLLVESWASLASLFEKPKVNKLSSTAYCEN